jgi:hypothetical protein
VPRCECARVNATPGGEQTLNIQINIQGTTYKANIWHPFAYYIPAGTMPDDEVVRFFQSLRRGPINNTVPGDVVMLDHHRLVLGDGGQLGAAGQGVVPRRCNNPRHDQQLERLALHAGWWAFQGTRANTTAYSIGQWFA